MKILRTSDDSNDIFACRKNTREDSSLREAFGMRFPIFQFGGRSLVVIIATSGMRAVNFDVRGGLAMILDWFGLPVREFRCAGAVAQQI